jgi:hypothetical protein
MSSVVPELLDVGPVADELAVVVEPDPLPPVPWLSPSLHPGDADTIAAPVKTSPKKYFDIHDLLYSLISVGRSLANPFSTICRESNAWSIE